MIYEYLSDNVNYCTGKLDPQACEYGGSIITGPGYGYCTATQVLKSKDKDREFLSTIKKTSRIIEGQEVFSSSWCDLGLVCTDDTPNIPRCYKSETNGNWINDLTLCNTPELC